MPVTLVVRLVLWLWFAAAVAAGHLLLLQRLSPAAPPAIILILSAMVFSAYRRIPALHSWVDGLELRSLVLLHVVRFVGVYFLVLHYRGELPAAFAVPAGFGDIAVALFALPVALAPLTETARRRAITIWNVVGFVDIMLVVVTAMRINLREPFQLLPLTHLPLSLLPTFIVPLIIGTHLIIFVRLTGTGTTNE
jgi:hypothetical protein